MEHNLKKKEIYVLSYKKGFSVDIVVNDKNYIEFWLHHKDYSIKEFMFGVEKKHDNLEEYVELLLANIDQYYKSYINEYMD